MIGQSVETCGFFPKCESFGCLLVQKFTKTSRIYHGWICVYNLFSFPGSFGSGLGLEKCKTRNFSIGFFSIIFHPCESYDVFLVVAS